ncbi:MAG: trimethylamine methyltransferase family protein [Candidatus Latescibacterota bacterium]
MHGQRLSKEQLEKLHAASLEVMEKTGVRMLDRSALEILKKGGCHVVEDTLVRFPPELVEWALDVAPKEIALYDQLGAPSLLLSGRKAYYGNGSDLLFIIDHRTGKRREPAFQDVGDMITLLDALPGFDFVMSGFIPRDVPSEQAQRWQMLAMLEGTKKPIVYVTTDLANTRAAIAMAEIVAGGEEALRKHPFAVNYINISHPLRHNPESIKKVMWLSRKGLPFVYRPSIVTRGISTPITGAGFLVVNHVAGLAGLVLSQLVREGAPFIRCGCSGGTFDMRTMVGLHAAPELRGFNEDMAAHYGLPMFGIGGLCGAKTVDQQAAYESALTLFASTMSGAQLIHDVGYMDNGTTGALDQLVICHEIIGWVKQYMKPLVVDEETLALNWIDEVVRNNGDFLQTDHTLAHFREDAYPELTERENYDTWQAAGSTTLRERAGKKVDEILETHRATPPPEETRKKLRALVEQPTANGRE